MKLHERYFIAAKARNEIDQAVSDAISRHQLTYGELLGILGQLVVSWSAYMVKDERQEEGDHGIVLSGIKKISFTWGGRETYTVNLYIIPGISDYYIPVVFGLKSCYEAQQIVFRLNSALREWNPAILHEDAELPDNCHHVYTKPEGA